MDNFLSIRPYLVPAYYDWLCDSGKKPHIVVDIDYPGVCVPEGYDDDGKIVLNMDVDAIRDLEIDNAWIVFQAVFDVDPFTVRVPMGAIVMMFATDTSWFVDFTDDVEPVALVKKKAVGKKSLLFKILPNEKKSDKDSESK